MATFLDFEKPIAELESKIEELRHLSDDSGVNIADEISKLQVKIDRNLRQIYTKLTPWQKVLVARHPSRPHSLDYIRVLFEDFTPLAGDRLFGEDAAIVSGLGRFRGHSVMVLGTEKGNDTESRVRHSFGMARPEGYRKTQRLMKMADRFGLPVVTLVDTTGAYPGIDAEARGQAEAIASSIAVCLGLRVPLISVLIGEGGSGGAIALATANSIIMLEHSVYSVISPEGCASILWRDGDKARETAAQALRLTASDLREMGVVDRVLEEPLGGAHRDPSMAIATVGDAIEVELVSLTGAEGGILKARRRDKFLEMGKKGLS